MMSDNDEHHDITAIQNPAPPSPLPQASRPLLPTRHSSIEPHAAGRQRIVRYHELHFAEQLDLAPDRDDLLHVIYAPGRESRLRVPAGWLSLCVPLAGRLQLESADGDWELPIGRMQVWRDSGLRVDGHRHGRWLVLTGPLATWSRHARALPGAHQAIYPRAGACPPKLRRALVRLARGERGTIPADPEILLAATCLALVEQQRDLHARLRHCSGRTAQRRQQTLLRLLRVRHLIEVNDGRKPDLARLARCASYSPWHLIRMYREVFGETPSEFATRLRLDRARHMVRDTSMPVCEITEALGFESQSAFCRAFKNAFGMTATELRRNPSHAATRETARAA